MALMKKIALVVLLAACGGDKKMRPPDGHGLSGVLPIVDKWWCVSGERRLGKMPEPTKEAFCEPEFKACKTLELGISSSDGGAIDEPCHAPDIVYAVTFLGSAGSEVAVVKSTKKACDDHRERVKFWDAKQISPCTEIKRR